MSRSRDESIFNFLETTCLNLWLRSESNLNQELKWRRSRTNIWWNRTKKSVISTLKSHPSEASMNNKISLFDQIRSQCWWHHDVRAFKLVANSECWCPMLWRPFYFEIEYTHTEFSMWRGRQRCQQYSGWNHYTYMYENIYYEKAYWIVLIKAIKHFLEYTKSNQLLIKRCE